MGRRRGSPPAGSPTGTPIHCLDLDTGAVQWTVHVPYSSGDWTTWIAGVSHGRLFASRAGNGASVQAPLHCYDSVTGAPLWTSTERTDMGAYDGAVFAPDGDPILASFTRIKRFDSLTGAVVWSAARVCSVSGNCGGALAVSGDALYVADAVPGGHAIRKHSLATGQFLYQGPTLPGFTLQNTPLVGPDGSIYLSRTQNNLVTDFFYAFHDTGTSIVEKWHVPAQWTTNAECAVGPDGSVYMIGPGRIVQRLDPATGAVLARAPPLATGTIAPRIATDPLGNVFVSNGAFSEGRVFAYDAALQAKWQVALPNVNIGGPAIGIDGTLVVAGIGTTVRAYRTAHTLRADRLALHAASGGSVAFQIDAGAAHAGQLYLLLGTLSGTLPGTPAGAFALPLNSDGYTTLALTAPNSVYLPGSLGTLDGAGHGNAALVLPSGLTPPYGVVAHHAAVAIDVATLTVTLVTNPVGLRLDI
jgi:outer membrane protein assembly factor BamB